MTKIPTSEKLPSWISNNIPRELVDSSLFRFQVVLQAEETDDSGKKIRKRIKVDILPDLDIDNDILELQMEELPAQYAFWAMVYSEVRLAVAQAERVLKARRGAAIDAVYNRAKESGIKIAADQVTKIVESDDLLIKADDLLAKQQMYAGKLYHMLEALKMKAELARSLAGFKKQERNTT